ncbi:DUF4132 domain-containing protein [Stackebrandtia soli]|uniref:DUF4132 domain-containing protein n=1 Tax=Stackebrandtia soli TaxID=1892856 RepID=UPI0039E7321A
MTTTQNVGTPEELAHVRQLAVDGDVREFSHRVVDLIRQTQGWRGILPSIDPSIFTDLPPERAEALHESLYTRLHRRSWHTPHETAINTILEILMSNLPDSQRIEKARKQLHAAGTRWTEWDRTGLLWAVRIIQEAGETLDPRTLATLRRSSVDYYAHITPHEVAELCDHPLLNVGEPWAEQANADLETLGEDWTALVRHARTATTAKPSAKWTKQTNALIAAIGDDQVRGHVVEWLRTLNKPRTYEVNITQYELPYNTTFDPYNANILRGLVWMLALLPHHDTATRLGEIVELALRKVPGLGPRSPKVANAAVGALARMEDPAALGQLARLASSVKFKGTLKVITKALDAKATELGISRDDIEELAIPDYGLTEVGRRVDVVDDSRAELTIHNGVIALTWFNDKGKAVKSPPASAKRDHPDTVKELKALVKDIGKMQSAQIERVDRQFLEAREWPFKSWRERYLDHPLLGTLGRRLIWVVDGTAFGVVDGVPVTIDEAPLTADDDATVSLWHPVARPVDDVLAWREWLERHEIRQPFKQAHREVYLLTEAEERTGTYSNRFAAHIVKQHQFHALAAARGWRNRLRLLVDDEYEAPYKELPRWGLRAEFWVEGLGSDWGADTTDSGSYLYLATDQVRFYPIDSTANSAHAGGGGYRQWLVAGQDPTEPLPIERVPPLVLSEVLRDVDLFVGVASIGNDPTWTDGGGEGRHIEYWQSYSFGDLSASAEIRKSLLERLVPRLAIADRAHLDGRFLVVRGDRRTYKIHLGSSNILMEPNDQYLCIVPNQRAAAETGGLFLPFEGDRVLSMILSKAMLLADDSAITDSTILSQLSMR